jgi:hypothetical protein
MGYSLNWVMTGFILTLELCTSFLYLSDFIAIYECCVLHTNKFIFWSAYSCKLLARVNPSMIDSDYEKVLYKQKYTMHSNGKNLHAEFCCSGGQLEGTFSGVQVQTIVYLFFLLLP